jgi:hypothetical protein
MSAFVALFADGYRRTIAHPQIKTLEQANKYAKDLELWFSKGSYPNRTLESVRPK